jgi:hypothetical protein
MSSVGGLVNTSRTGAGDESRPAKAFLNGLKPDEVAQIAAPAGDVVKLFVAGVPSTPGVLNPIRYVSSNPTNNPNSFDLWVDVVISGKTNRLSNWNKEVIILP